MPKEDLWLGTAGQDSGSCDSMVSTNSSHSEFSDNSYDYLSVEEKECLMFLEETIDSLDTEADSGVSADEIDYAERSKLPRTWPKRDVVPKSKVKTCILSPRELRPWTVARTESRVTQEILVGGTERCPSFPHTVNTW
ncbi:TCDD-inducible poly [Platysternon megacephalum]|uniref:TCDD-inducible poly n=1 Tax=Platysternon megacephalum TaxID=55544 RepID=A0A4D9DZV4_9SAUR|nr:TCDD-inducible poly [Platysternon megacephalum]